VASSTIRALHLVSALPPIACDHLDNAGFDVVIQVQDATWAQPLTLNTFVGRGVVTLRGNSATPVNCLLSPSSGRCLTLTQDGARWNVAGFTFVTTSPSSSHISLSGSGRVNLTACRFGSSTLHCIETYYNAAIYAYGPIEIAGNAITFAVGSLGAIVDFGSAAFTVTGSPAFAAAFVEMQSGAALSAYGTSFSGAATGKRYHASLNGVINTFGGGANFFPGNVAGTTASGGQYA
jgi:hypothetical protein